MASLSKPAAASPLLTIPLEVRHLIFHYVAARKVKPRDVLRYWFEKTEIREIIAEGLMMIPNANVTYVAGYNHHLDEDSEPEDEDEQGEVVDGSEDDDEDVDDDDDDEDEDEDDYDVEDEDDYDDDEEDPDLWSQEDVMGSNDGDEGDATTAPAPPVRREILPSPKWRHVPKFMRLTQVPPEANLFLISKQLNAEAKNWFYDVATLKIDATASFLHFSFFELALRKLADAPFSPMEHIKKADITFVWDSTWIRAEETGFAPEVFPVFLKDRAQFVLDILLRAPELETVHIHWHDSAEDDDAKALMAETLEPFVLNLKAEVKTSEHYIPVDAKPRAKSRAGKQRSEFQAIIDNGCETF